MLQITNQLLIEEATRRGWKHEIIQEELGIIRYITPDNKQYLLKSNNTRYTSVIGRLIADDKDLFSRFAQEWGLPIPATAVYTTPEAAKEFLSQYGTIVVKPRDAAHGNGVRVGVQDSTVLQDAVIYAKTFSEGVLLQQQVDGEDNRLLMINGELAAAAVRKPASVTGDGIHTIRELIVQENTNENRGENYRKPLNFIDTAAAERFLGEAIDQVVADQEVVQVVGTANIGTGGYAVDVTDTVSPEIVAAARMAAKKLNMPVLGVDFLVSDESARIIEINAAPSFGLHTYPFIGEARPVAKLFLDWLETTPSD